MTFKRLAALSLCICISALLSTQFGCSSDSEDSDTTKSEAIHPPGIQTTTTLTQENGSKYEPTITLTEEDNGKTIPMKVGDRAVLILDENLTTPYRWEIVKSAKKVIKLQRPVFIGPKDQMIGSGGQRTFPFTVIGKGTGTIALKLWWENTKVIGRFAVTIEVP